MGSSWMKRINDFLARLPGLPIVVAIGLVAISLVVQFLPDWPVVGWLGRTQLLLHIGVILGLMGVLLRQAL